MPDAPAAATPAPTNNSPFSQPINPAAAALANAPPKEVTRVSADAPRSQPSALEWSRMSPDARSEFTRGQADAGRTSASVHTRTPDGRVLIDGKLPDGSTYRPDGQTAPADSASPANATGDMIKIGDVELTAQQWADAASHKAESDLRATQVPASAADYKLELPADLKLPEGVAVKIDPNDPIHGSALVAAQNWAAANKLSQAQFSEMLGLYAASSANEAADFAARQRVEFEALGTAGPVRIDAVTRWLNANFGAAAKPLLATMVTRQHVEVFEKIIGKITNQGSASFTQSHRDHGPTTVSDEAWNTMTYSEKKAYAARASSPGNRR